MSLCVSESNTDAGRLRADDGRLATLFVVCLSITRAPISVERSEPTDIEAAHLTVPSDYSLTQHVCLNRLIVCLQAAIVSMHYLSMDTEREQPQAFISMTGLTTQTRISGSMLRLQSMFDSLYNCLCSSHGSWLSDNEETTLGTCRNRCCRGRLGCRYSVCDWTVSSPGFSSFPGFSSSQESSCAETLLAWQLD